MFGDNGADAGVIVADQDGAFASDWNLSSGRHYVGGAGGAGKHDEERGSETKVALSPDGAAVLLDDAAADGEAEAGSALLTGVGGLDLLEAVEEILDAAAETIATLIELPTSDDQRQMLANTIVGMAESVGRRALRDPFAVVDGDQLADWISELAWFGLRGVRPGTAID